MGFVTQPHMAGLHFFSQLGCWSLTIALLAACELSEQGCASGSVFYSGVVIERYLFLHV